MSRQISDIYLFLILAFVVYLVLCQCLNDLVYPNYFTLGFQKFSQNFKIPTFEMKLAPFIPFYLLGGEILNWKAMYVTPSCGKYNVKLLSILNLLCNTTQVANNQQRDACYGCFSRVGSMPPGPIHLLALSQCASNYLEDTGYEYCARELGDIINGLRRLDPILRLPSCSTGYCEFVRCIRRTNANLLINACFIANLVNRDFNQIDDRITFFTNTTACILTRSRCSPYNPITGELQQQIYQGYYPNGATNSVGSAGYYRYNALQIAPNGDIRVLAFPSSTVVGDIFCSSRASSTLEQSPAGCLFV